METYIPNHVGLIPDGGRRWARIHGVSLLESYRRTMNLISAFINFMFENDVKAISVYLLSKENLNRKKDELDAVVQAEIELLTQLLPDINNKFGVRVHHAGMKNNLPGEYVDSITGICEDTAVNNAKDLYLLIGYNYLDELKIGGAQREQISIDDLWVPKSLDLICRTSGEYRISGFLPVQSAYAELYFLDKHFNEITEGDFTNVLLEYANRNRRFGR